MRRTKIVAPYDGYIEKLPSKVGSFLSVGDHCATLVSLDPLMVVGAVSESDIGKINPRMKASAKLVTGQEVNGEIVFIAANSDENTRTFRIELEFPNPDGALKSGVTADIFVPLAPREAVRIPPRILTLNDEGVVGVRLVGGDNMVAFRPVKILSEEEDGIWIDALPDNAHIITVGQDFVKHGQKVVPHPDPDFVGKAGS